MFFSKLQQHRRVHIKQKLYRCFYGGCTKCYKHPQDLNRHTASHFSKKLECPLCDYSSNQKRLLKHHSAVHQNTPHYTCKSAEWDLSTTTKYLGTGKNVKNYVLIIEI